MKFYRMGSSLYMSTKDYATIAERRWSSMMVLLVSAAISALIIVTAIFFARRRYYGQVIIPVGSSYDEEIGRLRNKIKFLEEERDRLRV